MEKDRGLLVCSILLLGTNGAGRHDGAVVLRGNRKEGLDATWRGRCSGR